ncbi:uncharacterized protein LOC111120709 isoform X1 [Crassostrea virginica]|uniref:Uncharacterized protein LOC111120707 n=1 Tax=Crassostrea virginica TaxID=6565 RepID=A0A8B8CNI2_CRAVI|nr:uncharacterized protein LOC111120707 [Crassostrea virginica]
MKILTVLTVFLGISVQTTIAATCFTDAECGTGECCFRHDGPMIVSRRQLTTTLSHHGVCEKYQVEGDHCNVFDKLNGHCGCGAGLHCAFVPDPTTTSAPHSMFGRTLPANYMFYRCTPIL